MRLKQILFILLITFLFPACSLIHKTSREKENVVPRKTIALNTGGFPAKVVKRPRTIRYKIVRSPVSNQFVITEMPVHVEPPERAVKLKLDYRSIVVKKIAKEGKDPKIATSKISQSKPATKSTEIPPTDKGTARKPVKSGQTIDRSASRPETLTVSFALNSCAVTAHESMNLKHFIGLLKGDHKPAQPWAVDVVGYTCWLGSRKYNQWLALKRAKAVALRLKEAGIKIRSISGKGKCCYIDRKNPAPNRRAEVKVSYKSQGDCKKRR
jgi:outer membrane protein OmpA-like peptidoglycan-associated protein